MGWDLNELEAKLSEKLPLDLDSLDINSQYAFFIFNMLPDKIEGFNGIWLGKEFAGINDIFDFYEIEDKKDVFEKLLICIREYSKFSADKTKKAESKIGRK